MKLEAKQIIEHNGRLHALDKEGVIWVRKNSSTTPTWNQISMETEVDDRTNVEKIIPDINYFGSLKRAFVKGVASFDNAYAKNPYSPEKEEFKAWIEGRAFGLS